MICSFNNVKWHLIFEQHYLSTCQLICLIVANVRSWHLVNIIKLSTQSHIKDFFPPCWSQLMSSGVEWECICLTLGVVAVNIFGNYHLTTNTLVQINLFFFIISPEILFTKHVWCLQVTPLMEVLGVTEVSEGSNLTAAAACRSTLAMFSNRRRQDHLDGIRPAYGAWIYPDLTPQQRPNLAQAGRSRK